MHKITNVQVTVGGSKWSGSWEIVGDQLVVSSAYGSRKAPVSKTHDGNKAIAEELMRDIVQPRIKV
jgi:hypothetical protein